MRKLSVKLQSSRPNAIVYVTIHATKSAWLAVISNLTLSDWTMDCCKKRALHAVHGRPIEYPWIPNGAGVMVRKPKIIFVYRLSKRLQGSFKLLQN